MKYFSILALSIFCLNSSLSFASKAPSNEEIKARFQTALTAYDSHIKTYPDKEIIALAEELYQAGTHYYSKEDVNLGVLAFYYASALNHNYSDPDSIPYFQQAINLYKKSDEITDQRLISALV